MTRFLCSLLLAASVTTLASAKIDREIVRTFTVQPGMQLKASTFGGDIAVSSSTENVVKIVAHEHFRATSDSEADEIMKKVNLEIDQHGNTIVATAEHTKTGWHFGSGDQVAIEFEITVPADASADLRTSGGNISVDNLIGAVTAKTSGGDLKLGRIGGELVGETSGGNIGLDEGLAKVRLSTSGGNIAIKHLLTTAEVKTSGGDIKIESAEGALEARTSGGDIKVGFDGPIKGDSVLSTSGGQVKARVGKAVGFHLSAETSGGSVEADGLTLTIDHGGLGKSSLSGSVNGGGPDLRLRSSGGDIVITTR